MTVKPHAGQRWGYRARSIDRLVEVEVLRVGTRRPLRVLIRLVDDEQEGREEWVLPAAAQGAAVGSGGLAGTR